MDRPYMSSQITRPRRPSKRLHLNGVQKVGHSRQESIAMNGSTASTRKKVTHTKRELSPTHKANSEEQPQTQKPAADRPAEVPSWANPHEHDRPGKTRQGGVKRPGTEAPRSKKLFLNWNSRTKEREKPTHLREKQNCLGTTQPKGGSLPPIGIYRETGGGGGERKDNRE